MLKKIGDLNNTNEANSKSLKFKIQEHAANQKNPEYRSTLDIGSQIKDLESKIKKILEDVIRYKEEKAVSLISGLTTTREKIKDEIR